MPQELINWAFIIASSVGGWWLRTIWDNHRDLAKEVAGIQILVAGHYVKRDEMTGFMMRIENKLDAVNNKLDTKADR
jgi:hypothetical protein